MNFEINKYATLPILRLELIQDGRNDFDKFFDKIQNANIFFSMTELSTGNKKISKKRASTEKVCSDIEEYYIVYQFANRETEISGTFVGKFTIEFLDGSGTLIVPIKDTLYINVLDGGIKK